MKKQLIIAALAGTCLLSSCGAANEAQKLAATDSYNYKAESAAEYYDYDNAAEESQSDATIGYNMEAEAADYKQSDVKAIDTQMLVYSCDMDIDVLEFEDSVDRFHDLIDKYKGFLESENYSDGGSSGQWKYTDAQKWKTLNAVIRIPSASYSNFCKDAEKIGDLRRKNASVQNLTTEYSDLKTTLTIYEAKEKRYIELLSEIKNESEAISVENELTEIQIKIATLKTRMNNIENDVAYSYINLSINEVREYTEEPVIEKTDTFGQRLGNTVSRTWKNFLEFLEGVLFLLIRVLPYLLLLGIVLTIILKIGKAIRKRSAARAAERYSALMNTQPVQQKPEGIANVPTEQQTETDTKKNEPTDPQTNAD